MTCTSLAVYGFIDYRLRRRTERAGLAYETNVVLDKLTRGGDGAPVLKRPPPGAADTRDSSPADGDDDDQQLDVEDDAYATYLRSLDPTNCKQQDHYRVLGLSKLRYAATDAQIRKAHRRKVLHHHPDKRRARGLPVKADQEDYFACITRALEQLSDAAKRRAYDSVDPTFDERIPVQSDLLADRSNFFELFSPVFERNARWSVNMPVPELGDADSDRPHVEAFYAFWFDFSSWREFSYLDEEDVEKGENREERRWLDKQNQAARKDRRKAELKRVRTLVELAYASDPRVARFIDDDKAVKQRQKDAKRAEKDARRMAEETARREAEEAEKVRQQLEEEQKRAAAAAARQLREKNKRAFKAERRKLYDFVQEHDYFGREATGRAHIGEHIELMCSASDGDPERLAQINCRLADPSVCQDPGRRFDLVIEQLEAELAARGEQLERQQQQQRSESDALNAATMSAGGWTAEQTHVLVKAVQLFPAGTRNRWEVIAQYVNDHARDDGGREKSGKDVVHKVKALQKIEEARTAAASQQQLVAGKKSERVTAEPTTRDAAETNGAATGGKPWTADEQRLLEHALRGHSQTLSKAL